MSKSIKIPVVHYTDPKDIKKINNYLDKCANSGNLRAIREDKIAGGGTRLMFSNYHDKAMYIMELDKKGFIKQFTKF